MLFFANTGSGFINILLSAVAIAMAVCVAIPFHEFAHAYVAKREGDYTAVAYKRCTLSIHAHLDFVGFLMMFLFGFGWAKPVPIDSRNFKRGKKSQILVSIAGIVMNLILGVFFLFIYMLILKLAPTFYESNSFGYLLGRFLYNSITLNFGFAIFNILPIYPLDGYNLLSGLCRFENGYLRFAKKYYYWIFMFILITGILDIYYDYVIGNLLLGLIKLFSKILVM